ncbi:MAG: hypothetical protein AAB425_02740, partial [Bdellovibrionota bacterium]
SGVAVMADVGDLLGKALNQLGQREKVDATQRNATVSSLLAAQSKLHKLRSRTRFATQIDFVAMHPSLATERKIAEGFLAVQKRQRQ